MRENFQEMVRTITDQELEAISKDYNYYSTEERLLALNELASRSKLTDDLADIQKNLNDSLKLKKEEQQDYKISSKDFIPRKNYFYTPLLLYINVFIFLIMILSGVNLITPDIESLIKWGGNLRYLTINGEYWRLLSSVFIHAGILHLVFNMYALLYVGVVLETAIGSYKFIFAYILSGLIASVSSLVIHENIVSVGASGAIFGLYGLLLSLLLFKEFKISDISKKSLLSSIAFFVGYNIIYGFSKEGIDNAAHIGGLVSGFIIGLCYYLIIRDKSKSGFVYALLIIVFGIISVFTLKNLPDNYGKYEKLIKEFSSNEEKSLWMYKEDISFIPQEKMQFYKDKLNNEGILLWERNIELLSELKKIDYPEQLQNQLGLLIEYSVLRKKSCELMQQALDNKSDSLSSELKSVNKQIENKLLRLQELNKSNQ